MFSCSRNLQPPGFFLKKHWVNDGLNLAHVPYWRVNNPTLWDFCVSMIGRAEEGSKRNLAMNAWLAQASYPCSNFSDASSIIFLRPKGSMGHVVTVCIRSENQNQASLSPFGSHETTVLIELTLGHLRYHLTDVPPQPNSSSGPVLKSPCWSPGGSGMDPFSRI